METSKDYFEDILRRFNAERRGRSLFQYCKDEAVNYKDLMAYKRSIESKTGKRGRSKQEASEQEGLNEEVNDEFPELIPIDLADEPESAARTWKVVTLAVETPEGDVINLNCDNAPAVARLLSKLTEA